jgi:hypothetical protein
MQMQREGEGEGEGERERERDKETKRQRDNETDAHAGERILGNCKVLDQHLDGGTVAWGAFSSPPTPTPAVALTKWRGGIGSLQIPMCQEERPSPIRGVQICRQWDVRGRRFAFILERRVGLKSRGEVKSGGVKFRVDGVKSRVDGEEKVRGGEVEVEVEVERERERERETKKESKRGRQR